MCMRTSSAAAALLLLAACGSKTAQERAEERARAADEGQIECAGMGEAGFRRDCTIERSEDENGALILTVSHPDGAFRRLRVSNDGRGVVAADGAEDAKVSLIEGGGIEVSI